VCRRFDDVRCPYNFGEIFMTEKNQRQSWDDRFMDLAKHVADWSKDRSTKVGCVIVGPHREIRSVGFNGFPRGIDDDVEDRHTRPHKYDWTEHAERNAIYSAARIGVPIGGCSMYLPWFPCIDCARAIVQAGIVELVAMEPDLTNPQWGEQFVVSRALLIESAVGLRWYSTSGTG
jgi:dCMP deaminase